MLIIVKVKNMKRNNQTSQDNCSNTSSGDFNGNNISNSDVTFISKVTNHTDNSNKFVVLQEFINSFFEKAGALHNKIGECAGKDDIPYLDSDLLALRNFVEGTLAIPNNLFEIVEEIVQSLFNYYELIATQGYGEKLRTMSAEQNDRYIREFEQRKTEPVKLQRELLYALRNFIFDEHC